MPLYQYVASNFPNSAITDSSDLNTKISNLNLQSGNIIDVSTSGSGSGINVYIYFNNVLNTSDKAALDALVYTYTDPSNETICFVKEIQQPGTNGGTLTKSVWTTRTLNNILPPVLFLTLSNNQITINPGSYIIIVRAPAYDVNGNQIRLRNITNPLTPTYTYGMNSFVSGNNQKNAELYGNFNFDVKTTFDIQHICDVTKDNVSLGIATANGEVEIYTTVFVQKIA